MKVNALRGATTILKDDEDELQNATVELMNAMLRENDLSVNDVIYVQFSLTNDIKCAYPAKFARKFCGFNEVALMCVQEQHVENSLPLCLRVLIMFNSEIAHSNLKHQYLRGAKVLRPDLI